MLFIIQTFISFPGYSNGKFDTEITHIEHLLYFYPEKGEIKLNEYVNQKRETEDPTNTAKVNFLKSILYYKKSDIDRALLYLEKASIFFTKENNILYQAKTQLILGWIAEKTGYWEQAKSNYITVINLHLPGNKRELGLAYLGIVRCRMYLKQTIGDQLIKGTTLLKSMNLIEYSLYADYIDHIFSAEKYDQYIGLVDIAKKYESVNLNTNAASVYKSLVIKYKNSSKLDTAQYYIDKAILLSTNQLSGTSLIPSLYQIKGSIFYLQRDYNNAKKYLNKSIVISDSVNQINSKYYSYNFLYKIDSLTHNYKNAFKNLSLTHHYYKKFHKKEQEYQSRLLEISSDISLFITENNELKRNNCITLIISSLLLIIIITVSFWLKTKNKLKLIKEVESKTALQNLLIGLGEKKLLYKNINDIKMIDANRHFDEAYCDTIKLFKMNFTQLTDNDIRYSVMFTMGISDDVIAQIRNINIDSIRKTKRRIRNKLGLEKGTDLQIYFKDTVQVD
ncbi:helix-turn-helix transcriptional regulator [Saccharicrinis aurantiacus]|uniref:helix-turn-helix transcriptional regulator n=1 Tax=Saccharicrinis aurantiacus TaxID=1849719 RepID=UPI00094F8886|nr:hypothetical protein [Saccharicrinis aurantiacus]